MYGTLCVYMWALCVCVCVCVRVCVCVCVCSWVHAYSDERQSHTCHKCTGWLLTAWPSRTNLMFINQITFTNLMITSFTKEAAKTFYNIHTKQLHNRSILCRFNFAMINSAIFEFPWLSHILYFDRRSSTFVDLTYLKVTTFNRY